MSYPPQQCPRQDVHEAHDWWTGAGVARCPGLFSYQMDGPLESGDPMLPGLLDAIANPWRQQDQSPDPGEPVERDGVLVLDCQQFVRHDPHVWNRGELDENQRVIILHCDGRAVAAELPPGHTVHTLPKRHAQYVPPPAP